jgi:hypothetical protein
MSSPGARQRRRRQQYQAPRARSEVLIAVGAGVGIVALTALMIWLLRPGGLADRQPRSSWLIGGAIFVALVIVYALRPGSQFEVNRRVALPASLGTLLLVALGLGLFWPGGLLRHTPKIPPIATTPTTPLNTATVPSTGASGSTTSPKGATTTAPTTTAPSATTGKPATTTSGP